jgi:hypothetical protein
MAMVIAPPVRVLCRPGEHEAKNVALELLSKLLDERRENA